MVRNFYLPFLAAALSACNQAVPSCPLPPASDVLYVTGQGWHAEIGVPVEELDKNLSFYRKTFPGARVIMFGYGKKTFFTAPAATLSEYFIGPVPGPAVIHAVGLRVTPVEAYPPGDTITLALPPGGSKALSAYIWKDLAKDISGRPYIVAHSTDPDGLFYASVSEYNLFHTCNTWTADAVHTTGLTVSGSNVIFSGQIMSRVSKAAENQCRQ